MIDNYTVKQARALSGLSLRDVAKQMGVSVNCYLNKEKGITKFYYDEAIKFSSIVDIPIDHIIFFKKDVS